jgi:alkanesulfonate monooxygenase SsuD/methylene tetrahydromethanopterin reductase-like flavin-dependent oxidoreductase (luciferase family)
VLFEEKLDLFAAVLEQNRTQQPISWKGTTRAPLVQKRVYPGTETGRLTTWIGVGGSPESVVRAARYGLPLTLAIIGGDPRRFAPYVSLYHRALEQAGVGTLPIAVHSPGYIAETDAQAREDFWLPYKGMRDRIGGERGWPPMNRGEFEQEIQYGSLYLGSPETVAQKIASTARALGIARFDLKYSAGALPHEKMMRAIELYGTRVIPRVREILAEAPVVA